MNKLLRGSYLGFIYLFFYFPIAVLMVYSFNDSAHSQIWHGFTLDWYRQLFKDSSLQLVALHSLAIGILSATLATALGTIAAVSLFRYRFFGKQLLHTLLFILIVSPDIVMGISLLILFASMKVSLGFWTLLLAHITFCLPFVSVTLFSRINSLDKNIFEAAKDLGASDSIIFSKVIIPLMWPAILGGWLLSFTLSLDDVIISFFVTGPDFEILPLRIFSMVRLGVKPEVNALCSIMLAITLVFVFASQWAIRKKT